LGLVWIKTVARAAVPGCVRPGRAAWRPTRRDAPGRHTDSPQLAAPRIKSHRFLCGSSQPIRVCPAAM